MRVSANILKPFGTFSGRVARDVGKHTVALCVDTLRAATYNPDTAPTGPTTNVRHFSFLSINVMHPPRDNEVTNQHPSSIEIVEVPQQLAIAEIPQVVPEIVGQVVTAGTRLPLLAFRALVK
jgi:hypothetical protein